MSQPECPVCQFVLLHDRFEDTYNCMKCSAFYYPDEVGAAADTNAGYLALPVSDEPQRTGDEPV